MKKFYTVSIFLLCIVGTTSAEEKRSYFNAIGVFEGMHAYIEFMGEYCIRRFPQLESDYKKEKSSWLYRHDKHFSQVEKINESISKNISAIHGEQENNKYLTYKKAEVERQNRILLSDLYNKSLLDQNKQCKALVFGLQSGRLDISNADPEASFMILNFRPDS